MSQLFDNYNNKNQPIPDNEKVFLEYKKKYADIIVLGGTNKHCFLIPYSPEEVDYLSVTYIQGTEIKLTKMFLSSELEDLNGESMLIYDITPEESLAFNNWNKEVYAQIKAYITCAEESRIEYSQQYKIKIINTLEDKGE